MSRNEIGKSIVDIAVSIHQQSGCSILKTVHEPLDNLNFEPPPSKELMDTLAFLASW